MFKHNNHCILYCIILGNTTSAFSTTFIRNFTETHDAVFSTVLLNEGNDYSSKTGVFTCRIPGIYSFSATLTTRSVSSPSFSFIAGCNIEQNNVSLFEINLDASNSNPNSEGYSSSGTLVLRLAVNDTVNIGGCYNRNLLVGYLCSFSGFLVQPDIL